MVARELTKEGKMMYDRMYGELVRQGKVLGDDGYKYEVKNGNLPEIEFIEEGIEQTLLGEIGCGARLVACRGYYLLPPQVSSDNPHRFSTTGK